MIPSNITRENLQDFWMLGTLERLSSLGMVTPLPVGVTPEANDLYLYLDAQRLFQDPEDVTSSLNRVLNLVKLRNQHMPSEKDIQSVCFLVREYIENPVKLARFYLEGQSSL